MAEEIRLVGVFTDDITPKLKKLSKSINDVAKSFTKIQKKLRPIVKEMGMLAMASERVATALKAQKNAIDANSRSWSNYKKEVGQAAGAQRKAFKGVPRGGVAAPRMPRGGGGGGGGGAGRGAGRGIGLGGAGALIGSANLGERIGNIVARGVQMGMDLALKTIAMPFKFILSGLGERIQDEMSDIKAAGGIYSISKRMEDPLVKNFRQAEVLTKETNRYLAELAAALPGDTQAYIQVSKQIGDTVAQILANDKDNFIERGLELAAARGEDTTGFNAQSAFKEVIGNMTKLTVLASGGQGVSSAMGLPMLTEQMLSQDQIGVGQFRKYAAVRNDPQIMGALERNIAEINKTAKLSVEREKAVTKMYEEVVTPEFIRRVSRSTEGLIEVVKTAFLNPEVGLLGLGRPLEMVAKQSKDAALEFNDFGEMLYVTNQDIGKGKDLIKKGAKITAREIMAAGASVEEVAKASQEALAIYDYLRDIFANIVGTLSPLLDTAVTLIPIFDDLGRQLDRLRTSTAFLTRNYVRFQKTLEVIGKELGKEAKGVFMASIPIRSSLATFTAAVTKMGGFSEEAGESILQQLMNPDFSDFGSVLKQIIDKVLNGPAAKTIGKEIGTVFGQIVRTFADILSGIFGDKSFESDLVKGFFEGFNMEGIEGQAALQQIVGLIFDKIGDAIKTLVLTFPKESLMVGAAVLGPGLLGPLLPVIITKVIAPMGAFILAKLGAMFAATPLAAIISGWLGGLMPAIAAFKAGTLGLGIVLKVAAVVLAKFLAVVALVVGAILGLFAIFRHLDFIASSVVEGLNILGQAFVWMAGAIHSVIGRLAQGLGGIIGRIPGLGGVGGALEGAGAQMRQQGNEVRDKAQASMANSAKIIEKNTAASFARTRSDGAAIVNFFKGGEKQAKKTEKANKVANKAVIATAEQMKSLAVVTKAANSTFENNARVMDENGKAFGWAMLNGKEIMVEWGSVAGTTVAALNKTAAAADNAAKQLDEVKKPLDKGDIAGASAALTKLYPEVKVPKMSEIPQATISAPERKSLLGEMVTGLNNWWSDRMSKAETYNNFTENNPLPDLSALTAPAQTTATATNQTAVTVQSLKAPADQTAAATIAIGTGLTALSAKVDTTNQISQIGFTNLVAKIGELGPIITTALGQIVAALTQEKAIQPVTIQGQPVSVTVANADALRATTPPTPPLPAPPDPVIVAGAASTSIELPKIAANTAPVPPKIDSVSTYLKTLCDKVDMHGKDHSAKLAEVKSQIAASSNNIQAKMGEISSKLDSGINVKIVGTPTVIAKMDISGLGGGTGGPSMFTTAAAGFGLQMTSGYRPGDDDSYHGLDRARDYAGDPQNMKKFASFMAASYGGSLKELIYTPLGYSISNGQVVAPYATSTHYDHVHVAYANGIGKGQGFTSQDKAIKYEEKMAPPGSMVASITSNSSELMAPTKPMVGNSSGMGSPTYNQSVTVNVSGAGLDDEQLANMVAGKVLTAVQQATFTELDIT